MGNKNCFSCAFFEKTTKRGETGVCRRYPPQASGSRPDWLLPVVFEDDWCGEYLSAVDHIPVGRRYGAEFGDLVDRVSRAS